jgi:hypothetical protein
MTDVSMRVDVSDAIPAPIHTMRYVLLLFLLLLVALSLRRLQMCG